MHIGIGTSKIQVSRKLRALIQQQVTDRLSRFADAITNATVLLSDHNGRRGGGDKRCRIELVLAGGQRLRTEEERPTVRQAFVTAISRAESAVYRQLRGK